MKGCVVLKVLLVLAACLMFTVSAYAEVATSYGVNFRLRQETWDNIFDQNYSDQNSAAGAKVFTQQDLVWWRLRTTPWFQADLQKQFTFYVRLVNEMRYYVTNGNGGYQNGYNKDELEFDNLYLGAKGLLDSHLDLKIGRQDLLNEFGENFLIADGTPGDGSRTYFFNAARAKIIFNQRYNLDLVYLFTENQESVLPMLYDNAKRTLNTSDEVGAIVYGRGKVLDNLSIEPYYMYKDEKVAGYPYNSPLAKYQLNLHTFGGRVATDFGQDWSLRGEYAHQFGEYNDGPRTGRVGDGGTIFLGKKFNDIVLKPSFDLGYIYLSGDKNDSTKVEGWDPLWSRFPWLSDLAGNGYYSETGVLCYWTNLQMARADFKFVLTPQTGLELAYNHLWANDSIGKYYKYAIYSPDGKNKGDLVQLFLTHNFTDKISGMLQIEDFMPGDYYLSTNRDNTMFVRWELQWKI